MGYSYYENSPDELFFAVLERTFNWMIEANKVIMGSTNVAPVNHYKEYHYVSKQ